jgi:Zn-dependent protease with chaperone function
VTVLSDGLMAALEPDELRAVLHHENAHLSQHHHLLLWAFAAWRQALPWLPTTRLAQEAVSSLIEMLADDVALKTESKAALIKAIAIVASGSTRAPETRLAFGDGTDAGQPGATGGAGAAVTTASRVSRLLSPRPPLPLPWRFAVLCACLLLLAVPTALLLVPGLLG